MSDRQTVAASIVMLITFVFYAAAITAPLWWTLPNVYTGEGGI